MLACDDKTLLNVTRFLNFGPRIMSLELVKLGTLNLIQRSVVVSTSVCVIRVPRMWCLHGHVTSVNFRK